MWACLAGWRAEEAAEWWGNRLIVPAPRGSRVQPESSMTFHACSFLLVRCYIHRCCCFSCAKLFAKQHLLSSCVLLLPMHFGVVTGFLPGEFFDDGNSVEQRGGVGVGGGGGQGAGALDPLTRKSFIHFVAKAGDGFAAPPAGGAAAAVAAAFAITGGPSGRVAASVEEQEGDDMFVCCWDSSSSSPRSIVRCRRSPLFPCMLPVVGQSNLNPRNKKRPTDLCAVKPSSTEKQNCLDRYIYAAATHTNR